MRCTGVLASQNYRPVFRLCTWNSSPIHVRSALTFRKLNSDSCKPEKGASCRVAENLNFRYEIEVFAHICRSLPQFAIFPVLAAHFLSARRTCRTDCSIINLPACSCRPKSTLVPLQAKLCLHAMAVKRARRGKAAPLRRLKHHWRAVRRLGGRPELKLLRHGLMSSPPRRV